MFSHCSKKQWRLHCFLEQYSIMEYAHGEFIQSTLTFICRWGYKIVKREEFANLRLECLVEIIQQDKLRVKDEKAVFEAVYRWGEAECGRQGVDGADMKELRKVLDKPLKYIRFPLMDSTEFALSVATKNILDLTELTTLLTCFLIPPERRNILPAGRFSSTPRKYMGGMITIGRRDPVRHTRQKSSSSVFPLKETLMIRCDDDVYLKSLRIWKSVFDVKGLKLKYLYDTILASVTIKCGQETFFQLEKQPLTKNGELLELKFKKSFTFPSDQWVELNLIISGSVGYCGNSHCENGCYGDCYCGNGYSQRQNSTTLQNCYMVTNYEDFIMEQPNMAENSIRVRFKRGDGDTMQMAHGIIENFTFEAV